MFNKKLALLTTAYGELKKRRVLSGGLLDRKRVSGLGLTLFTVRNPSFTSDEDKTVLI